MSDEIKLNPCPFCGTDEPEPTCANTKLSSGNWYVECWGYKCNARGPVCYTKRLAIEAWNNLKGLVPVAPPTVIPDDFEAGFKAGIDWFQHKIDWVSNNPPHDDICRAYKIRGKERGKMSSTNACAFPYYPDARDGLTKRELFAAMALPGLLANTDIVRTARGNAKLALEHADVLIDVLKERGE